MHQFLAAENGSLKQRVDLTEKDLEIVDLRSQLAARDCDVVITHERTAALQTHLGEERRRRVRYAEFVRADVGQDLEANTEDFLESQRHREGELRTSLSGWTEGLINRRREFQHLFGLELLFAAHGRLRPHLSMCTSLTESPPYRTVQECP